MHATDVRFHGRVEGRVFFKALWFSFMQSSLKCFSNTWLMYFVMNTAVHLWIDYLYSNVTSYWKGRWCKGSSCPCRDTRDTSLLDTSFLVACVRCITPTWASYQHRRVSCIDLAEKELKGFCRFRDSVRLCVSCRKEGVLLCWPTSGLHPANVK